MRVTRLAAFPCCSHREQTLAGGPHGDHYNDEVSRTAGPLPALLLVLSALVTAGAAATPPCRLDPAVAAARQGKLDAAFLLAQRAAKGQPDGSSCVQLREWLRQRATLAHLERAHQAVLARRPGEAGLEFRAALALSPDNPDARQGLAAVYPAAAPAPAPSELRVQLAAAPVEIQPTPGTHGFQLRAPLRQVVAAVMTAYGLRAFVADSVPNQRIQFDLGEADFAQAMAGLHGVAGIGWIPLDAHTLYFTLSSQLDRITPMATRTFYLPEAAGAVELTQTASLLRSLLGIDHITPDAAARALSVRATPAQLDAAERLLLQLSQPAGEVVLEIRILDVTANAAHDLGLGIPDQFTMFALGPLLAQLQNNNNLQQTILQLFEQGGLNAVLNSGTLSQQQLQQFQSTISPLLQNPFVTFGGGTTLMALSVPDLTAQLRASQSRMRSVETAVVRAHSGEAAELKIGQRYPVINASFSPVSLSSAISQVIGNGSFIQPFPSFTYEDLGLDAKLTPVLGRGGAIRLDADLSITALTGASNNDIPILSNRHLVTSVSLRNNEPVLIGGLLTRQQMTAMTGLPGLSQIPGLSRLFSIDSTQAQNEQLVLMITPHVVQLPPQQSAATWLPASFAPMGALPALTTPAPSRPLVPAPNGAPPRVPPRAGASAPAQPGTAPTPTQAQPQSQRQTRP